MDSVKHGDSEASSDENDQPERFKDNTTGTRRLYECTFCKRGFTNAQALGGHMNIHRKDKAKAKQSKKSKEDFMANSRYFAPIFSNEHAQYHATLGPEMNYQFYFPDSNPSFPHAYYQSDFKLHEEHLGANLSLQIGPSRMEDSTKGERRDERENMMENEVDLELRLGHDP